MVSKGVRVYSWVGVAGFKVTFTVPKNTITRAPFRTWSNDLLEVDSHNISGLFDLSGLFTWTVAGPSKAVVASGNCKINALTGDLESGTMMSLPAQQSVVSEAVIVSYGFYDAGPGAAGLPNTDLCWVAVTPNWSSWMGIVAPVGSGEAKKPFSSFVLPTPHDVGMNSMQNCNAILNNAGSDLAGIFAHILDALGPVGQAIAASISTGPIAGLAPDIISGLSITQKDSLSTMLAIGARYFEFRPAHISSVLAPASPLPDKLFFQHSAIPGMAYDEFLVGLVSFLIANPAEIIVVQLRSDGVDKSCRSAAPAELADALKEALELSHGSIKAGGAADLKAGTDTLRNNGTRLIMLNEVAQYSSYSDSGNATLTGSSIVSEFEKMSKSVESSDVIAIFQCQATATNIKDVVIYSVLFSNTDTSCLMCTKPICDQLTLPWLQKNLLGKIDPEKLVIVMNDFLDGATADVAIKLSQQRLSH